MRLEKIKTKYTSAQVRTTGNENNRPPTLDGWVVAKTEAGFDWRWLSPISQSDFGALISHIHDHRLSDWGHLTHVTSILHNIENLPFRAISYFGISAAKSNRK